MVSNKQWTELYNIAKELSAQKELSQFVNSGAVGAVIVGNSNKIYKGVSLDTACSIGFCAERNAIGSLITDGDISIQKMVAVLGDEIVMPCGVCREFMMQINLGKNDVEVLTSINPIETKKLSDLVPLYWVQE